MASFNLGVRPSEVMDENEKSLFVVVKDRQGRDAPYHVSKKLTEWKTLPGETEPTLFAQTWYAKQIGIAG